MSEKKEEKSAALEEAELRKALAEAEEAELKVEERRLQLRATKRNRKRAKAKERFQAADDPYETGIYLFNQQVNSGSVYACKDFLRIVQKYNPGLPIRIEFNSPGGSVIDGWELFDAIREASAAGHEITTVVVGRAASMAGILVQAGDVRLITKNSYLHLHQVSAMTYGKVEEMKQDQAFYDRLNDQACQIYSKRSGGKTSAAKVAKMIKGQEVNLGHKQALELGFVDAVEG